ncbi:MAG TPA: thiamine phosphate synthase, partial [Acidimicrobiales bacterium]|nr:thiamine phosphate synthase [Acidimicrobiales bacterium]
MPGALAGRSLYLCVPDRDDLERFVAACCRGGVDVVQLREKQLDARPLIARARILRKVCTDHGVPFILNDRPDLAVECEADGVHVGQDDAPPSLCRRLLGARAIVGLSTHARGELVAAQQEPVDYLSVGPVTATPTKPGRPGTGLAYVEEAAARLGRYEARPASGGVARTGAPAPRDTPPTLPFFVTGGVTPETVLAIAGAGARRFVVVRYLTTSDEPEA